MNHVIIVIRIGEEKQKEYTHILCGSEVCLHPGRVFIITLDMTKL